MKSKTNISVKDIRGVRITPSIELGDNQEYTSGDILDANATLNLVRQKIDDVINGASSAADTLKEIEDIISTINSRLNDHDSAINGISQGLSYASATANQNRGYIDDLRLRMVDVEGKSTSNYNTIEHLKEQIERINDRIDTLEGYHSPGGLEVED